MSTATPGMPPAIDVSKVSLVTGMYTPVKPASRSTAHSTTTPKSIDIKALLKGFFFLAA